MTNCILVCFGGALCLASLATVQAQPNFPVATVANASVSYFGTVVNDPYQWMEKGGSAFDQYLSAADASSRDAMAPLAADRRAIADELRGVLGATDDVTNVVRMRDHLFFMERLRGGSAYHLMTRSLLPRGEVDLFDPSYLTPNAAPKAIEAFAPSWDARLVVVGTAAGGAEDLALRVLDVKTRRFRDDAIDHLRNPQVAWSNNSRGFYYSREISVPSAQGAPNQHRENVFYHQMGKEAAGDRIVFGPDSPLSHDLSAAGHVSVQPLAGSRMRLGVHTTGVASYPEIWLQEEPSKPWHRLLDSDARVLIFSSRGSRIYFIAANPEGSLSSTDSSLNEMYLVPGGNKKIINIEYPGNLVLSARGACGLRAAKDALYVYGLVNGLGTLYRVAYRQPMQIQPIALPLQGTLEWVDGSASRAGVTLAMTNWTKPTRVYSYNATSQQFFDTGLARAPADQMADIVSEEITALSSDGTPVPLSIVYKRGTPRDGRNPTLMSVYGAYGFINPPLYASYLLPWLKDGGVYAVAHVRGGGELGERWHLAGQTTRKQRSVDDLVACAEALLSRGYTSPGHLAVKGKSAGGLLAAALLVQRPDLVHAVIDNAGVTDLLRSEQRRTGGANASEYGTVRDEQQFRAMDALSPYANLIKGRSYPAVLFEAGANDPRVPAWMEAKMFARLRADNVAAYPALLLVDWQGGHGADDTLEQQIDELSNEFTFLKWQLGPMPRSDENQTR